MLKDHRFEMLSVFALFWNTEAAPKVFKTMIHINIIDCCWRDVDIIKKIFPLPFIKAQVTCWESLLLKSMLCVSLSYCIPSFGKTIAVFKF